MLRLTLVPPSGAVTIPPQVVAATPEMDSPLGNASVNGAVMLAAVLFGLLSVRVSIELCPARMVG